MNIFLDDSRMPEDVTWVTLPKLNPGESWHIAKSVEEFVMLLEVCDRTNMRPTRVSFDHDLSDEHYADLNCDEGTGQEAAIALCYLLAARGWDMPEYAIHTMNPIGAKKIAAILEIDFPRMCESPPWRSSDQEPVKNSGLAQSEVFTKPAPHSETKVILPKKRGRKPKAK